MDRNEPAYSAHLKDWYAGLLEEGWTLIDGPFPTFTKENCFIEFDPVSFISPDMLGLWVYALDKGRLTERKGIGTNVFNDCVFPILEFNDGATFNVSTLTWA